MEVVDDNSAKTAYENYLKDPTNKVVSKRIHDYMVAMGLDACKRNDIPMQIHTGMGECTMINMFTLSPAYLYPLFTDPRYLNKVKIVLLHSGYPHVELTGYLVNQFPHLYTDFSSVVPFASIGAAEKFLNLLERAPVNKIQFGSDSGGFPELAWFGPIYLKRSLPKRCKNWWMTRWFLTTAPWRWPKWCCTTTPRTSIPACNITYPKARRKAGFFFAKLYKPVYKKIVCF